MDGDDVEKTGVGRVVWKRTGANDLNTCVPYRSGDTYIVLSSCWKMDGSHWR